MRIRISVALFVMALALAGCHSTKGDADGGASATGAATASDKIPLEVFAMSGCPYWVEAVGVVAPFVRQYSDFVDFKLYFIGEESEPGVPSSMHGEDEVKADILFVCTSKHAPDKLLPLLECMYGDPEAFPGNFGDCATKTGVDADVINACANGSEGKILVLESFKTSEDRNVTGSPTIMLNSQEFDGPRTGDGLARAVCGILGDRKPEMCAAIPEPLTIGMTIITDSRCEACGQYVEAVPTQLKQVFPGLQVRVLDFADPAAVEVYNQLAGSEFRFLPAFLFDQSIKQDPLFQQFEPYLKEVGPYFVLATEADFDPRAEICDNGKDDDGNNAIDCADESCSSRLVCRQEIKKRLDVFVMSKCPYGAMAVLSMPEFLTAFGADVEFSVHFLVTETFPGQFQSLHGPAEVAEDFRQVCAQKHYKAGNKFMEYFLCRAADYESDDWQKCAINGIDPQVLKTCSEGDEGRTLLSADATYSASMNINASPSWVANNRTPFSGLTAAEIQAGYCTSNPGLAGCATPLSGGAIQIPGAEGADEEGAGAPPSGSCAQ